MQAIVDELLIPSIESENGMATVESLSKDVSALAQRLTAVETKIDVWGKIIGGFAAAGLTVGLVAIGWSVHIGNKVTAIEQQLADGGNSKLVTELKAPKSPEQLQANLNTVIAQVQTARVIGKKPDQEKITALSNALAGVAQRDPQLSETWRAVAMLASYRTVSVVEISSSLPDCDVNQEPRLIDPSERPEIPAGSRAGAKGYVFRNCTLHMDHLPTGKLFHFYRNLNEVSPNDALPGADRLLIGWTAFIINCNIMLNDSGISESPIIDFEAVNCRFIYQIENTPTPSVQKLLLASLEPPTPGRFSLGLPIKKVD